MAEEALFEAVKRILFRVISSHKYRGNVNASRPALSVSFVLQREFENGVLKRIFGPEIRK
jgi:hypothetical protein